MQIEKGSGQSYSAGAGAAAAAADGECGPGAGFGDRRLPQLRSPGPRPLLGLPGDRDESVDRARLGQAGTD